EWYDIHSNVNTASSVGLGIDQVPKIVEKRLIEILNKEIKLVQESVETSDDMKEINNIVSELVKELNCIFSIPVKQEKNQEDIIIVEKEKLITQEKMRFFKPSNLKNQIKAEEIDRALDIVRPGKYGSC
nr:hypothetical protein [Tatlockia sp.]